MNGPAKNRLHDYEAGWLTLLVSMGIATKTQAEAAMWRIAQKAVDDVEERREKGHKAGKRKRKSD